MIVDGSPKVEFDVIVDDVSLLGVSAQDRIAVTTTANSGDPELVLVCMMGILKAFHPTDTTLPFLIPKLSREIIKHAVYGFMACLSDFALTATKPLARTFHGVDPSVPASVSLLQSFNGSLAGRYRQHGVFMVMCFGELQHHIRSVSHRGSGADKF